MLIRNFNVGKLLQEGRRRWNRKTPKFSELCANAFTPFTLPRENPKHATAGVLLRVKQGISVTSNIGAKYTQLWVQYYTVVVSPIRFETLAADDISIEIYSMTAFIV